MNYIFSSCSKASNIISMLAVCPNTSSSGQSIPCLAQKYSNPVKKQKEFIIIVLSEQVTFGNQQTLRVVSEEQETSVLSPTRTASLTCKNRKHLYIQQ